MEKKRGEQEIGVQLRIVLKTIRVISQTKGYAQESPPISCGGSFGCGRCLKRPMNWRSARKLSTRALMRGCFMAL